MLSNLKSEKEKRKYLPRKCAEVQLLGIVGGSVGPPVY